MGDSAACPPAQAEPGSMLLEWELLSHDFIRLLIFLFPTISCSHGLLRLEAGARVGALILALTWNRFKAMPRPSQDRTDRVAVPPTVN